MATETDYEYACGLDEVRDAGPKRVTLDGTALALFHHEGAVRCVALACPHMGFPLTEGSVDDGVLTCQWHHARFELTCGDTFDPFADDVATYPVEVRDGDVYVDPSPASDEAPADHWRARLEHGLREDLGLIVAKAIIGLDDAGVPADVPIDVGASFGTDYRAGGWGRGLTTLGVMANLLDDVRADDRRRALYVGLSEVADECAGEAPYFPQDPLDVAGVPAARLREWVRDNVEVRDADGAERALRAAIAAGADEAELAGTLVAAATDHRYLDSGHALDFVEKAFAVLDAVGFDHADDVLPALVPVLADADRAGERSEWRRPVDVAGLVEDAAADLPALVETGDGRTWDEPDGLVETLLGDDPRAIVDALTDAIAAGAGADELARVVAYAAGRRVAQFGTANEFGDWNTVHHTYTYANAVRSLAGRTDVPELHRGVLDAAVSVYLDRFLNTPPAPLPDPDGGRDPEAALADLAETFEVEGREEVNRAGEAAAAYLAADGDVGALKRRLGTALLREDVGFHPRQNLEAAFACRDAHAAAGEPDRAAVHLVAAARYLCAHTPTRRSGEQTFTIADRLARGERIHEA